MKYLMFVCTDPEPDTDKENKPDIDVWVAENDANGRRLQGNVLAPKSSATTADLTTTDIERRVPLERDDENLENL
ncbi:hypothetical protein [Micromonospora sp. NPDC005806]|uniref:hypothetical protein n=1 Tax=Micromonospora sp. NPDC005806 TaxID=3364234 RepID=UPI00367EE848